METYLIYITAADTQEARRIGKMLVTGRLASCVNIIENMNSIYIWNGKLQDHREAVLIAKTIESKVDALVDAVKTEHSYECPCIVSLPITGGNPEFLDWVAKQVR